MRSPAAAFAWELGRRHRWGWSAVCAYLAWLLVIGVIGFPATATLMFVLVSRAFGSRRYVLNAAIGAVFALICWFGFSALGVQLRGLFPAMGL